VLMSLAMMDDQFENYAEGRVVPPVEPEAIKRRRNLEQSHSSEDMRAACARDSGAVMVRYGMIQMLIHLKLLAPWQHGEELDDGVYRVAATFPMRVFSNRVYKVAGDDIFPFDPNAFVQRLVEETGISHTWDPIPTKIGEDDFVYSRVTVTYKGQEGRKPDLEREAKRGARDLLWDVWSRYRDLSQLSRESKTSFAHTVAILFADFVIDNIDLARELTSVVRGGEGAPLLSILRELERRAQGGKP
jgi:hypothetical protein